MFFDLIEKRRSIRKFKPVPVEPAKVDKLIETALRAPSSRGLNPWQFVVVDQPELLEQLSTAKPHGGAFLKNAGLGIVVVADPEKCDVWVEDCSIAAILIQLAAQALGLGSCWVQIRRREHNETMSAEAYIRDILSIPDTLRVASVIAVGYPDETKAPHPAHTLQTEKVHINRYGN